MFAWAWRRLGLHEVLVLLDVGAVGTTALRGGALVLQGGPLPEPERKGAKQSLDDLGSKSSCGDTRKGTERRGPLSSTGLSLEWEELNLSEEKLNQKPQ
jgi:hypothetical protein